MLNTEHLLSIADAYGAALAIEDTTISHRVFNDSKKLGAVRAGKDISVRRYNAAIEWFSANWPEGAVWPHDVPRPEMTEAAQ